MTYIINFDQSSGKFIVRSTEEPSLVGRGEHLFAAIDELENKIASKKSEATKKIRTKDTDDREIVAILS